MTPVMPNETVPDDSDNENVKPQYNDEGEFGDQDDEEEDEGLDELDFDDDDFGRDDRTESTKDLDASIAQDRWARGRGL